MATHDPQRHCDPGLTTSAVQDEFQRRGIVRLDGLISGDVVTPVRQAIHDALEELGVCKDGVWTGERLNGLADVALRSKIMKGTLKPLVKKSPRFAALQSDAVLGSAETLVGGRALTPLGDHPQLLFTPPDAERWFIPNTIWHLDAPRLGEVGCPGVQMFALLDTVEQGGGGTLVVAGSHRFLNDSGKVRSKKVVQSLRQLPWFAALLKQPHDRQLLDLPGQEAGVEVQVVECTGKPGDVYLMDMRVIHTVAPNVLNRPRLMASQRYYLEGLAHEAYS